MVKIYSTRVLQMSPSEPFIPCGSLGGWELGSVLVSVSLPE